MKPKPKYDLTERIRRGIDLGVSRALEAHRKAGQKVAIWRDGRVVEILPPKQRLKKQDTKFDFFERVDRGVKRGVAQALAAHRKAGEKVSISRNGRIIEILPPLPRKKKRRKA
jgi:hypothetical protein